MADTRDNREDDERTENEDIANEWTEKQTEDRTEDQTVDMTRERTLEQDRGPTDNEGVDPTRLRAKDEEVNVIDPMAEAKQDEDTEADDSEHTRFKLGDDEDDEE